MELLILGPTHLLNGSFGHVALKVNVTDAWSNQTTNGDYVTVIADLIIKLVNKNSSGVYNVGTEEKTWFNLTKQEFKTNPIPRPEIAPFDISMNINKMKNEIL